MALFLKDMFDFDGYLTLTGQYGFDRSGRVLHRLPHDPEDIRILMRLQEKEPFPCLIAEAENCFMASDSDLVRMHFTDHGLPEPALYDIPPARSTRRLPAHHLRPGAHQPEARAAAARPASRTPPATATT